MGTASPTHTVLLERARECHPCGGLQSAAGPRERHQALSGHTPSFIRQSGGSPAQQWLQQLPCKGLLFSKGGVVGQVRLGGWKYLDDDFGSQALWLLETGYPGNCPRCDTTWILDDGRKTPALQLLLPISTGFPSSHMKVVLGKSNRLHLCSL